MDSVSDTLISERTFGCVTVVDKFSRECVAIYPPYSIPAVRVMSRVGRPSPKGGIHFAPPAPWNSPDALDESAVVGLYEDVELSRRRAHDGNTGGACGENRRTDGPGE